MSEDFLPFALPDVTEREIEVVVDAIRSGWLTTGPSVSAFEERFAEFLGEGLQAVSVNSATAGLHLAVEALGIGPGDEVIVPTWTFTATAEVVRYVGATPRFVDVERGTLNIDYEAADALVNDRTVAVMPVHYAGLPVDPEATARFAAKHGLAVIEDAAHSFPVKARGRYVGDSASDAVVFSFYATKTITTGEGGMLVTRNPDIAQRARVMRLHGISRDVFDRYTSSRASWEYDVIAPGFKYNLTDIAAALGLVQLDRAWEMCRARQAIASAYDEALGGLPLTLPPSTAAPDGHARHLYPVQLSGGAPLGRNEFISQMAARGVGTSVHFKPLHLHPYWRDEYGLSPEAFPVATRAFEGTVSLPIFSSMSSGAVTKVIDSVRSTLQADRVVRS